MLIAAIEAPKYIHYNYCRNHGGLFFCAVTGLKMGFSRECRVLNSPSNTLMISRSIYRQAGDTPSKVAVVHSGVDISYAALANAIASTVIHLEPMAFTAGSTVVVLINNLLDCWVTVAALQQQGCITVCVHSSGMINTLELGAVAGIVTTANECSKHQRESGLNVSGLTTIPQPHYDAVAVPPIVKEQLSSQLAGHIMYTSGTTGQYKKVFLPGTIQHDRDLQRSAEEGMSANTIYHVFYFGLWSAIGYFVGPAVWSSGGTLIMDGRADWGSHFFDSDITHATIVADLASQLLQVAARLPPSPIPRADCLLKLSAGFMSSQMAENLQRNVSKNLWASFGSSEVNGFTLESPVSDGDDWHWLTPSAAREIQVVDDVGNCCALGEEGLLRMELISVDAQGYLDNPEASAKVFKDGYYYPGDLAVQRADGRIRILGRSVDVLNIRGRKMAVAPIEHKLQNMLAVEQVCLFSGITSNGEEEIVVVLETKCWPDKTVLDHLGEKIVQFDRVRFNLVKHFPRTDTGTNKINRVALRALVYPEK